ncbi:hypothetical protein NDU88_008830 [Pleurodeles waltl]|uniref:Uncharacterized protein n=1 Tax=Pleurodeles waltl TaxID=8319 RepID=A0AAV7NX60_PLEWA|nr:hypothetical protein NDU88_008830 [Pleurodeles waltl]
MSQDTGTTNAQLSLIPVASTEAAAVLIQGCGSCHEAGVCQGAHVHLMAAQMPQKSFRVSWDPSPLLALGYSPEAR